MNSFTNKHRYFVQFMLHHGVVKAQDALTFFEKISTDRPSSTYFKTLINEINREICNQSFKIAIGVCEITCDRILIWVNTKDDEISRQQSGFSPIELEYFHAILQELIGSEEHSLRYPRVINISSTLTTNFLRENGEKALMKWLRGGYFVKKEENVFLGPRALVEFTTYLKAHVEDSMCNLCSELVFVGDSCGACYTTFHKFCIEKYLQNQTTCPSCKASWEAQNGNDTEPGPSGT